MCRWIGKLVMVSIASNYHHLPTKSMIPLFRRLRVIPEPKVSRDHALELAKAECTVRGWPWHEPAHLDEGWRSYFVRTNARSRGGNVLIRIAKDREAVISATFVRR
jgi:hypothetical protein